MLPAIERKDDCGSMNERQHDNTTTASMQKKVLEWFERSARDLPWRHTRDPYHILVAEMMLQQTQVERVLPRYAAFLATFPTLYDLAAASTADVIKLWAGLGYNRRAVNLQRIACIVRDEYAGQFPRHVEELQKLPGIGPYTSGAIACFAFEQDVPCIDTNIRRVLVRCFTALNDVQPTPNNRTLYTLAQSLIPVGQGWMWNQAIMEIGATICTATDPKCWRCPLMHTCCAYATWYSKDQHIFSETPSDATKHTNTFRYPPTPQPTRRVAERTTQTYIGSNRYYRGRIVDQLRELPPDTTLPQEQLAEYMSTTYGQNNTDWLHKIIDGLVRDGLVEVVGNALRLASTIKHNTHITLLFWYTYATISAAYRTTMATQLFNRICNITISLTVYRYGMFIAPYDK